MGSVSVCYFFAFWSEGRKASGSWGSQRSKTCHLPRTALALRQLVLGARSKCQRGEVLEVMHRKCGQSKRLAAPPRALVSVDPQVWGFHQQS